MSYKKEVQSTKGNHASRIINWRQECHGIKIGEKLYCYNKQVSRKILVGKNWL